MQEHLSIIAALQAGDTQKTIAAIDLHLVQTLRWWGL
jgi:DNA-binding GntR family transcriptional regulator|tara:strand:- start:828 stop:938 length:111 start_codon:yes stop_codon:yes gene_type:complete